MQHIFSPIAIEADLDRLRFCAPTANLAARDRELARFVDYARSAEMAPCVFEVPGIMFPTLIPLALWEAPMWVHWLGPDFDEVMDELAETKVEPSSVFTTDLRRREVANCFRTSKLDIYTFESALTRSASAAYDNEVLSIFVSPAKVVSRPQWLDEGYFDCLNATGHHCGISYRPTALFTKDELDGALLRSVLCGNWPTEDPEGRPMLLLESAVLPPDWFR